MPVDSKHSAYEYALSTWRQNRDAADGERAVKDRGEAYLPRLSGQDKRSGKTDEYIGYLARAAFFPATGRTVNGLQGLIALKPPLVEVPDALVAYMEDVDLEGQSIEELANRVVNDVLITGRGGLLVEYPVTDGTERTLAEAEGLGLRAYVKFYPAENIFNWRIGRVNGKAQLVEVRLQETYDYTVDEWTTKSFQQIRVLSLTSAGYNIKLFRKEVKGGLETEKWEQVMDMTPIFFGEPSREIPFVFVGPRDSTSEVQKAPITDLAAVNMQHFRNSADYENGLHWAGKPTPVFTGDFVTEGDDDVTEIRLGSQSGIHMTMGSDAKMLVASGMDLEALRSAMDSKKDEMTVLGARIIAAEKKAAEAAETASIHRAGESSVLAALAASISKSITKVLNIMAQWTIGAEKDVARFELNKDFVPENMTPEELSALVSAWQSAAITKRELFDLLVKGEIISAEKTYEEHEEELETENDEREVKAQARLEQQLKVLQAQGGNPKSGEAE